MVKIQSEGISSAFKDQLFSGFQSLYIQKFKQRYTEYTNYVKDYINTTLRTLVSSIVPTTSGNTPIIPTVSTSEKSTKYVFTKPFKSNEYNQGIKALQNLLTKLQLYT